ncbi:polymeric immunoglobulin receptor-like [Hoplias malabaricus]|uniref:polymeric immunoglobulin receptor-like n=1 Tax=Hoplias malabaricus TaxID=27720 RepID=UPI003462BB8E
MKTAKIKVSGHGLFHKSGLTFSLYSCSEPMQSKRGSETGRTLQSNVLHSEAGRVFVSGDSYRKMHIYSLMISLILSVFFLYISESESVKTLKDLAVKSGGSLTIPCFYNGKYKSNPKYWCKGKYWSSCGIVARTNTRGRTLVTDYPTQNMFLVELNSLQESDSGDYWCAVEIGDKWTPDESDYLYLTVSADPAVSVINSRVSGQEEGSISVQCLYRTDYKNKQKQWCRFRDWSCLTSQNSAVQISDDGRGAVSVEMSGLKKSDAGWYWFSAGEVGVTVHLTVTERPTNTTRKSGTTLSGNTMFLWILLAAGLGLLVSVVTYLLRRMFNPAETRERISDTTVHTQSQDSKTYTKVKPNKRKPSSAAAQETDFIYVNVASASKNTTLPGTMQ